MTAAHGLVDAFRGIFMDVSAGWRRDAAACTAAVVCWAPMGAVLAI
jgi:hypothetical protein